MIKTVLLADLTEDWALYPRHAVDSSYVAELARSIAAGQATTMPPPVVDEATSRIVDGFHRTRAYRKVRGPGGSVDVDVRAYASETDLLVDAVRLNAGHGRKLDVLDRVKSVLMLERAGLNPDGIATVMRTSSQRVTELRAKVVIVTNPGDTPGTGEVHPAKPIAGGGKDGPRTLTREQYNAMLSSSGWRATQTVSRLIRELETGLIDVREPGIAAKLQRLADVIGQVLPGTE